MRHELTQNDLEKLARSWISPTVAAAAGLYRVDGHEGAETVGRKFNGTESYEGIVFPYFKPDSPFPRENRLRRDNPPKERKGEIIREKDKYLSPPGRGNLVYFMPRTTTEDCQNPDLPVVIVEGEKKGLALWRLLNESARRALVLAIPGVWNWKGTIGREYNEDGRPVPVKGVIPDFELLNLEGRTVTILFDVNVKTNPSVEAARRELASELRARYAKVRYVELPDSGDGVNGIDDFLFKYGPEAALDLLDKSFVPLPPNPLRGTASLVAEELCTEFHHKITFDSISQEWFLFKDGIWKETPVEPIEVIVGKDLGRIFSGGFSYSYLQDIVRMIRAKLMAPLTDDLAGLLPFRNGMLELSTGRLLPHSAKRFCTWCLPYEYDPFAGCEPVENWLLEVAENNEALRDLLIAVLRAVLLGKVDLQRFVEIIGPGGTGKSTFLHLATSLVGYQNTFITELKHLESSRFETAGLYGKRLCLITDSDRYGGSVSVLKSIVGQDTLRNERKHQKTWSGFTSKAMVLVAANEPIQATDYTSGLERRRITIPFLKPIPAAIRRTLLEFRDGQPYGEWIRFIPGVVNSCLQMPESRMKELLIDTERTVPYLKKVKLGVLCETNSIVDWLENCCVYDRAASTQVGVAERNRDPHAEGEYKNGDLWLYPNYCNWVVAGGAKPVSLRRFSPLLEDVICNQLKLSGVWKNRDMYGTKINGLRLKTPNETGQSMIDTALAQFESEDVDNGVVF